MKGICFKVETFEAIHCQWAADILNRCWGSHLVISRGRLHDALDLPGFVALVDGQPQGLVTYRLDNAECELVTLNSERSGISIGSTLLAAVVDLAATRACRRVWLVTTNDNLRALRFYQRRGFVLAALHRDALLASRRLKPEIPEVGADGIPLRDELELELLLPIV